MKMITSKRSGGNTAQQTAKVTKRVEKVESALNSSLVGIEELAKEKSFIKPATLRLVVLVLS